MEYEADMYGLNAARQPDGEANVDLLLGEYRKLDPGPIEEFVFYDHPSGRTRITAAMRWKAEHPETASPEEMNRPLLSVEVTHAWLLPCPGAEKKPGSAGSTSR